MRERIKEISNVTLIGAVANVLLALLKLVAGLLGRSAAMVADAVHSFSDLVSDVIVLTMVPLASKDKDKGHDYGHGKFETLATLGIALLLVMVAAKLMASGVTRIRSILSCDAESGFVDSVGPIAFWAAIVSIAVKEIMFHWTAYVGKKFNSPVVVANAWHHRSDALSSVASALGIGLAVMLGGKWIILDPIVSCGISIFILLIAVKMAMPALGELTDASLDENMKESILEIVRSTEGVEDVHELKTRRSGPDIIIDVHVVVNPMMTVVAAHRITEIAEEGIRKKFGSATQISIHVEPSRESK